MKKLTRFVSVLLSALMVASMFTALNFTAFAADSKLTIRANSNIFPTQTQEFDADTNQITVTWWMQVSDANMVNTQCVITYDSSKLAVDMTDGVNSTIQDGKRVDRILRVTDGVGTVTNYAPQQTYLDLHENNPSGKFLDGESDNDASIKVNSVNLEGRELTESNGKVPFVSVTFNPKDGAQGVTNVNLYVEIMQIRGESEEEEHYFIARSEIADNKVSYMPETPSAVYAGTFDDYSVQAGDVFTVAGTANFLGTEWEAKPTVNVMTKGSDGNYTITVPSVKAVTGAVYEVKVVEFKNGDQSSAIWHGVPGTGNNVDFGLKSDCDVTVTYNPSTGEIKVTGTGVTDPSYKIDYVAVVGNGKDVPSFVNGKNWDPTAAANKMTASSNVYEITYKNVAANKDLEFKFAANGAWALNWGNGSAVTPGTAMDAYDGGENIKFNYKSSKSTFDLTLKLDLTNWDADKKTGAKFTVTAKDSEEPTEAPTTAAPTTAAPTTAAPTTAAPTTAAPTTKPVTTTKPTGDVFTLAGSSNFLGTAWAPAPDEYVMTKGSDGNYTITVKNVKAIDGAVYQVKVVQFVDGDTENPIWHGKDGGDANVDFGLSKDCDVTVTYNPNTKAITVTGAGVTEASYKIDYVTVVGNGKDVPSFVNGVEWDPAAEANKMTAAGSVYEITYKGVAANKDLEFKFTANGAWALSWGNGAEVTPGTAMDAYYNGENFKFNYKSTKSACDLTLKLDLTNWDAKNLTGAKFTLTAKDSEEPTEAPTTKPVTTTAPTTTKPVTTTAPTTTKPSPLGDVFTLAGSSNFVDCGWEPTPDDYVMTKGGDGIYRITVPSVAAEAGAVYQVKVVEFKDGDTENPIWHGKDGGDANVDFGLKSDCDVTVTYNPTTKEIKVTGAGVTEPTYNVNYVTAVGNGYGNFLNGVNWGVNDESNRMEMVSADVYEITYEEVDSNTDLKFKFAANGTWVLNWGYTGEVIPDTPTDAHFDGADILFNYESENDYFDITLRLDLTNWDADKRTGAKFTVTAKDCEQPTTEKPEPTTVAPTTAAPTTVAPTTVAPTTVAPTTVAPTTVAPTTEAPTTEPVHVHTIVVDKGYPATCTSTGLTDGSHCETCGEVIKAQEVIPMHPDTMVVKGYPATYEKDGLTDGVRCKRCGTWVVERQVIPKLIRYGDVNRDGEITIEDATLLQKFIAELVTFNEDQKRAADTNGDGQIRIDDVTEIQKYVAELIHELGPKQTSS